MPIKIMGEELVAIRDEQGRVGLLGLHCSHRGADLSYGRLEDGGLRCIYHGWLYDIEGRCLAAYCLYGNVPEGYSLNWHVPIDDECHWKFTFMFSRAEPLDKQALRRGRSEMGEDYRPVRNRANRYLQDRESMKAESYSGVGMIFQVQDLCATEGAGPIQDRSQEHLTAHDIGLVVERKLLLKGIKDIADGKDPLHVIRDPADNHFSRMFAIAATIPIDADWKAYWRDLDLEYGEVGTPSPSLPAPSPSGSLR